MSNIKQVIFICTYCQHKPKNEFDRTPEFKFESLSDAFMHMLMHRDHYIIAQVKEND